MLWKKKGQREKSHCTWTKPRSGRLHKYYYSESLTLWLKWRGVTPIHTQLKWGLFRREITLDEALFLSQRRPCKYWQFKGPQVGNMCSHKGGSGDLWVCDGHVIPLAFKTWSRPSVWRVSSDDEILVIGKASHKGHFCDQVTLSEVYLWAWQHLTKNPMASI